MAVAVRELEERFAGRKGGEERAGCRGGGGRLERSEVMCAFNSRGAAGSQFLFHQI